jgi:hypothetical protein
LPCIGGDGHHIELIDSLAALNSGKDGERDTIEVGWFSQLDFGLDRFVLDLREYSIVGSTHLLFVSETNTHKTRIDSTRPTSSYPAPQTKHTLPRFFYEIQQVHCHCIKKEAKKSSIQTNQQPLIREENTLTTELQQEG